MSINFEVASKTPADVSAIGIAVSTDGAMPKEVSLSRKTLDTAPTCRHMFIIVRG